MMAGQLFALALPALTEFTSPRAWAFGLIGIHEYLRRLSGDSLVNQTRETLTCRLMELFDASAHPDWQWFEEELSYDNAKLAQALIVSGHATGQQAVLQRVLVALRWLTELQISEQGHFRSDTDCERSRSCARIITRLGAASACIASATRSATSTVTTPRRLRPLTP